MKSITIAATVLAAALLLPTEARAQAGGYITSTSTQTYAPLTGATTIPLSVTTGGLLFGTGDDGYTVLPIGFDFTYFGQTYTHLGVSTNGIIFLMTSATGANACSSSSSQGTCRSPTNIPTTNATLKTFVAPWWDDLDGRAGGVLRYKTASDEIAVEYSNWDYYFAPSGSGPFEFTVRFKQSTIATANDIIQIHYGAHSQTGSGSAFAQAGIQDPTTTGWNLLSACGNSPRCAETNFPTNTLFTILSPVDPELEVQSVTASSFAVTAGTATFNYSATVKNIGQQAANNWHYKVYLSKDKLVDATDLVAFDSSSGTAQTTAATATTTLTGTGTVNSAPIGNYYVLVEVDSAKTITEALESNNIGSTAGTFTVGVDLVSNSLTGAPANTGPGAAIALTANIANNGSTAAGTVNYSVVVSQDQQFSTSDFVVHSGTVTLTANQTIAAQAINFTLPSNTPGGVLYFGVMLDPSSTISESVETNNAAFASNSTTITQADLQLESADIFDPVTGNVSRASYMGDTREIRVTVRNIGGAVASGFNIGVILSKDKTLSMQPVGTDYTFADNPSTITGGYTLAQGTAAATYTFTVTMPSTDKLVNGQPLQTGDYYLFVTLDSFQEVSETRKDNNTKILAFPGQGNAFRLFTQAPDLAITKVQVPTATAVGEVVPVYRAIRNVGILDAPALPYRYYASANDLITEDDIALEIVKADGTSTMTSDITLAKGAVDTNTDFVRLPAGMPPGIYYVGAIIDQANTVKELDENNNQLASTSTISVAAPAMRVTSAVVPDAVVDRPFVYQLTAVGAPGALTWAATSLPAGLILDASSGTITGTPTVTGIFAFDVTASAGGRNAAARLVMRVLANSSELVVTTMNLPPIVNSSLIAYSAVLSAAGGSKPYTWKILSGAMPTGITLRNDGSLSGAPAAGTAVGETRVTFEVTDGVGNRARSAVKVRVVAPGAIIIKTLQLPDGMVNTQYTWDLTAEAAAGGVLASPLTWSVSSGSLPEGVRLTTSSNGRGLLEGKPFVPGTYLLSLQVEDAFGRTDSLDYVVRVFNTTFKVVAANVPLQMHPGDNVTFNMSSGSGFQVKYDLYSGALPPGLTMDEAGVVSGTIDEDPEKAIGTYNLVVTARDLNGGSGMGAVFMEVTRRPAQEGCSATGSDGRASFGAVALLIAAGLMLARRSKLLAGVAAAAAVAFAPAAASAQTITVNGPFNESCTMLTSPTVVAATTSAGVTVNIPFPVKFYGQTYNNIGIAALGYLAFSGDLTEYSNQTMPHSSSSYPALGIFPWWDDLETTIGTQISYKTIGTAPNREFVVEWKDVIHWLTTGKFSFQARIYEGTSKIKFNYCGAVPTNATASVGIMGGLGVGVAGLACASTTSRCGTSSFPTNRAIEFSLPPDLVFAQLSGDDTGYANVAYRGFAQLTNEGGTPALQAKARFYLSTNGILETATDTVLGDSPPVDLAPGQAKTVNVSGLIPASTTPGNYFILAKADPDGTMVEADENNNTAPPFPIVVGAPAPDIQPLAVATTSSTAVPGQTMTITRTFYNGGNAAASGTVKYTYFLSDNQVASYSDFAFTPSGSFNGLAAGAQNNTPNDTVTLPNDLPAGRYWIGVCADYDSQGNPTSTLGEISEVNNCITSSTPFIISTGSLAIITTSLQPATQHSPYGVRLDATGGNGVYQWSLAAGALPPGMEVSADGFIRGSPSAAGNFSFEVKVVSGTENKTQALTLGVSPRGIPLAVVDQDLPTAEFGKAYKANLIAIGGKPPYTWTLKSDSIVPPGIGVASDGTVEGRSTSLGDFVLSVEVQDADNVRAAKEVKLSVANPTQLSIKTARLTTAYVGKSYNQPLEAAGGKGGYVWRVERFQQLAQGPTDVPYAPLPDMPATFGLIIYADPARPGSVALDGIPTQAGLYAVTLRVRDSAGVEDVTTLTLLVSYDQALALTTTALPDAFVNRQYNARLSSNATAATSVTFAVACVQQVAADLNNFTCATADERQTLPPGLFLGADGTITGTPTAPSAFDGATPAIFSFLIKVSDAQGRYDVRALTIKLRPDFQEQGGGCASAGSAAPMLAAALGVLAVLRRRRK